MIKKKLNAVGMAAMLSLPFAAMQCGGDSPPSHGQAIYREDRWPQGVAVNFWGASGYYEISIACWNGIPGSDWVVETTGPQWFGGGGDSHNPGLYTGLQCSGWRPYIVRRTETIAVWG